MRKPAPVADVRTTVDVTDIWVRARLWDSGAFAVRTRALGSGLVRTQGCALIEQRTLAVLHPA